MSEDGEDESRAEGREPRRTPAIKVDADGLSERIVAVPGHAGQLPRSAFGRRNTLYYIRQGSKDAKPAFQMYDLAARKETALGSVDGFEISADGKKMLVSQDGKYGIIDLPKGAGDGRVNRSTSPAWR